MNKKWIIILICTGVVLLLGSLCTTFYVVYRMNKVEDIIVFSTETETTEESTTMTSSVVTTETTTTTIVTTSPEVTTVTEALDVIEAVPNNNNNNNNDDAMTRGQWYEENGYGGYPNEQETFEHDEYMSVKNSSVYIGEFYVKVELVEHNIYSMLYDVNISGGDAVAGVHTGLNIGDKIYVAGCGYFTIVHLTDTVIFEKDDKIVCFADELLYGPNGSNLGYFDTDVYLIE